MSLHYYPVLLMTDMTGTWGYGYETGVWRGCGHSDTSLTCSGVSGEAGRPHSDGILSTLSGLEAPAHTQIKCKIHNYPQSNSKPFLLTTLFTMYIDMHYYNIYVHVYNYV